ncbi:hypothetical protein ABIE67_010117 [Streptomyces sp. V4I8]|uniref:hypothetical protein n=1 Tax=Streptomyces sp. V4I8 TaxID=3156469 RepID=UPI0035125B78
MQVRQLPATADAGDQGSGARLERNAREDLQQCSDLLEELLEKLRRMESDYLDGAEGPSSDRTDESHADEHNQDAAK